MLLFVHDVESHSKTLCVKVRLHENLGERVGDWKFWVFSEGMWILIATMLLLFCQLCNFTIQKLFL